MADFNPTNTLTHFTSLVDALARGSSAGDRPTAGAYAKWVCNFCARESPGTSSRCSTCNVPRHREDRMTTAVTPAWQCPACTFQNGGGSSSCGMCGGAPPHAGAQWTCVACTTRNAEAAKHCSLCNTPRQEDLHEFARPVEAQLLCDPVHPAALVVAELATQAVEALRAAAALHEGTQLPLLRESHFTCMLPADLLDPSDKRL